MKNEIREFFKTKRKNFETVRHPFYNYSLLTKVGNKYLYFLVRKNCKFETIKIDMNKYFAQFCK